MRTVLVGGQYGDEGKGKIVSYLSLEDKPKIIARGGVGPNAGHEVHYRGKRYPMRMLSCGFLNENARILIGAGVVVNPSVFLKEVEMIGGKGRCAVDFRATIITPEHLERDASKTPEKIGSTKTGCGPAVMDRAGRVAKTAAEVPELKEYLTDVAKEVNEEENVLVEASQGFMLSVLYGTYPFVTSKDVSASTVAADVGLGPTSISEVIMVIKAYTTRVGGGPFEGEITEEEAKKLGMQEYGTVTGRPRRINPDLIWDEIRKAAMINGATQLAVTKIDIKFPGNEGKKKYEELTDDAKNFIQKIEQETGIPVTLIGTGPDAEEIIDRRKKD